MLSVCIPNWDLLSQGCNSCFALYQLLGCQWIHHNHSKILISLLMMTRAVLLHITLTNHCCQCLPFLFCVLFLDFTNPNHLNGNKSVCIEEHYTGRRPNFQRRMLCKSLSMSVRYKGCAFCEQPGQEMCLLSLCIYPGALNEHSLRYRLWNTSSPSQNMRIGVFQVYPMSPHILLLKLQTSVCFGVVNTNSLYGQRLQTV